MDFKVVRSAINVSYVIHGCVGHCDGPVGVAAEAEQGSYPEKKGEASEHHLHELDNLTLFLGWSEFIRSVSVQSTLGLFLC